MTDCSSQISMHMDASIVRMLFSIIFDNIVSIRFRESKINKTINEGKKRNMIIPVPSDSEEIVESISHSE